MANCLSKTVKGIWHRFKPGFGNPYREINGGRGNSCRGSYGERQREARRKHRRGGYRGFRSDRGGLPWGLPGEEGGAR